MTRIIATLIFTGILQFASAQQTRFLNDDQKNFHQAKEYFQREQYSLAYPLLKDLSLQQRETDRSNNAINYQEIKFYTIVCGLKQNEEGAEGKARDFINLEDNEARVDMMSLSFGRILFPPKGLCEGAGPLRNGECRQPE